VVVHALKAHDPLARIHFYNWFLRSVLDREVDSQLVFFSDETCFSLHGEVNSQNNRYWNAENPGLIHKLPLHDKIIDVWSAMSTRRVIGSSFTVIQLTLSGTQTTSYAHFLPS
jgi:hypothetical protein